MIDNEPFERRVGQRLKNKWTLERLLGVGGMAAVYVGVNTLGRREAIKILHPEVAANRDLRERFTEEGRAVNRFRHPGAVAISDIDVSDDGQPFLVMELLEGGSLADLLRHGHVPSLDTLLRLADELLDVLVAAHAVGIIHRDIKPDNLFVQSDGKLKVLDFGIARVRTEGPPTRGPTRTGVTIGTVAYMPPEQVMGRSDIDARVDIFAVGATLFRVLSGRSLHEAASQFEMMVKAASDPAPALSTVAPGVPADVALVVDRALAFDRTQRYPDARTMQDDVRSLRRHERPPYATSLLGAAAMSASQMVGPTSYGGSTAYTPTQSFQEPPRSSGHAPASASTAVTNPGPAPYAAPPASAPYAAGIAPAVPPLVPSPPASHAGQIPPAGVAGERRQKLSAPLLGLGALMTLVLLGSLLAMVRGLGASETPAAPVSGGAGSGGSADDAGAPDSGAPASTATTPGKVATAMPGNGSPPAATNLGMPFPVRVVPGNIDAPPAEKDKKEKKKKGK